MATPQKNTPDTPRTLAKRLRMAIERRGTKNTGLAKLVNKELSKPGKPCSAWNATRVKDYSEGEKEPGAKSVRVLAKVLDVSADWLLRGVGPISLDQDRPRNELAADLAAEVRRVLHARLHASDDGRFAALTPEHLEIDPAALLERIVNDAEARFREQADRTLHTANLGRVATAQVEVIESLVNALPLARTKHAALRSVATLREDAAVLNPASGVVSPVALTEEGVAALLAWWESPEATREAAKLRDLAERIGRAMREHRQPEKG